MVTSILYLEGAQQRVVFRIGFTESPSVAIYIDLGPPLLTCIDTMVLFIVEEKCQFVPKLSLCSLISVCAFFFFFLNLDICSGGKEELRR